MRFFYLTKNPKKKSIYFISFRGQYSDSPRAISEEIHKIDPSITIYWKAKEGVEMPSYINKVFTKFHAMVVQSRADAWVMNNMSTPNEGTWKSPAVFFVETWHGDRGFKLIAYAAKEAMGNNYKDIADNKANFDLFTAGSDYGAMKARKGLRYDGEILMEGLPRNDKLVNIVNYQDEVIEIREKLKISLDTKILLYAPTFRDKNKNKQNVVVDLKQCLDSLNSLGEKWVCLIRAHSSSFGLDIDVDKDIIDVTNFGDMSDLLLIADCLITDYSSCAGDFVLTKKPCVLAHFDREQYETGARKLWYNPDETGYLIARTQEEINRILCHLYEYDHAKIAEKVNTFYGTHESGKATSVVVERLLKWIYRDDKKLIEKIGLK